MCVHVNVCVCASVRVCEYQCLRACLPACARICVCKRAKYLNIYTWLRIRMPCSIRWDICKGFGAAFGRLLPLDKVWGKRNKMWAPAACCLCPRQPWPACLLPCAQADQHSAALLWWPCEWNRPGSQRRSACCPTAPCCRVRGYETWEGLRMQTVNSLQCQNVHALRLQQMRGLQVLVDTTGDGVGHSLPEGGVWSSDSVLAELDEGMGDPRFRCLRSHGETTAADTPHLVVTSVLNYVITLHTACVRGKIYIFKMRGTNLHCLSHAWPHTHTQTTKISHNFARLFTFFSFPRQTTSAADWSLELESNFGSSWEEKYYFEKDL